MAADPTFRDFVCLYIAEGYKRRRHAVQICNPDPAVMQVATGWIRRLTDKRLGFSIQYHADQDLAELCEFWGGVLGIDPDAIRMQRKSNSGELNRRTWRPRHGVIAVSVHETLFRARLQAWMDRLRSEWG